MANMSYCRFENTNGDVIDCIDALVDREISSDEEKKYAKRLLVNILDFCKDEGIIEDYNIITINDMLKECE
jgi:hypothetical protein